MLFEALKLSWRNIWRHPLRTLLATLGVTFGIGAVIAVTTMTAGIERSIVDVVARELLKADMMLLATSNPFGLLADRLIFTERDIRKVEGMPNVKGVEPLGFVSAEGLYFDHQRLANDALRAVKDMEFIPLAKGRGVQGRGEIVLGSEAAKELRERLGEPELLGKDLTLLYEREGEVVEEPLKVVGVTKEVLYTDRTLYSYVHLDYYHKTVLLDGQRLWAFPALIVWVDDVNRLSETKERIESYLKGESSDFHRLIPAGLELEVDTLESAVRDAKRQIGKFTAFLGAIGAVALFVGLIGIMNIMLINARERTREVGIMKAIGATDGRVLQLFLTESVIICLGGSALGILIGTFGSIGLSAMIASLMNVERIPFVFTPGWYLAAVLAGGLVGLLSGVYPAWSAARVDPVRALRYE